MIYAIIVAAVFAAVCLVGLICLPRLKRRNYLDVSTEPIGRVAIQDALEGFASDHAGLRRRRLFDRQTGSAEDLGRRINELRDLVNTLARNQRSESDIYVIVLRVNAMILGVVAATIAAVTLIVTLLK